MSDFQGFILWVVLMFIICEADNFTHKLLARRRQRREAANKINWSK